MQAQRRADRQRRVRHARQAIIGHAGQRRGVGSRGLPQERGVADQQTQINVEWRRQAAGQGELPKTDGAKLIELGQEGLTGNFRSRSSGMGRDRGHGRASRVDGRTQRIGRLARVRRAGHRATDGDDGSQFIGADGGLHGRGQVAALRADAGRQEPRVRRDLPHGRQRLRKRSAHDQPDILVF